MGEFRADEADSKLSSVSFGIAGKRAALSEKLIPQIKKKYGEPTRWEHGDGYDWPLCAIGAVYELNFESDAVNEEDKAKDEGASFGPRLMHSGERDKLCKDTPKL